MTKKEMFGFIAEALSDNADVVEFCNHEIELLERASARKSSKATPKQIENENFKVRIAEILDSVDVPVTATEIKDELDENLKVQRVSALLSQMIKDEKVVKTYHGKVALFTKA